MRISDWSSDVCSSDLPHPQGESRIKFHRASCPREAGQQWDGPPILALTTTIPRRSSWLLPNYGRNLPPPIPFVPSILMSLNAPSAPWRLRWLSQRRLITFSTHFAPGRGTGIDRHRDLEGKGVN